MAQHNDFKVGNKPIAREFPVLNIEYILVIARHGNV